MAGSRVLFVDYADPPSLAGLLTLRDGVEVVLWHPAKAKQSSPGPVERIIQRHAAIVSASRCLRASVPGTGDPVINRSVELFAAAIAAIRNECRGLVWPISSDGDTSAMMREVDRANLVVSLIDIGADQSRLQFDLPVVDLEDQQIVDLIEEGGSGMIDCWPCEARRSDPCNACTQCSRWRAACKTADVAWPWGSRGVPVASETAISA